MSGLACIVCVNKILAEKHPRGKISSHQVPPSPTKSTPRPPVTAIFLSFGSVVLQAPKAPAIPKDNDRVFIPLAGFSAGAENGSEVFAAEIADYVSYNREYIRRLGVDPARLVVITVAGDSMAPTLSPGDQLLIAKRDGEPIIDRAVYVLYGRYGGVAVKRLYWRPNGALHIIGDAQEEPSGVIDMRGEEGEWRVVGRVLRVEKSL